MTFSGRQLPYFSHDLEQRVLKALYPDGTPEPIDWESAIETVIMEWGPETHLTRDDAVDVVEFIQARAGEKMPV